MKLTHLYFVVVAFLFSYNVKAQCFEIESILVDACGPLEGLNEMVRFKVGPAPLNTANLVVSWPNNAWVGLIQNATTASQTAALNAEITTAGGCAQLIEPTGGVLPANSTVILVTSFNLNTAQNPFGAISENIYILYQNNPSTGSGHFANFGVGIRTLTMSFGSCFDIVSYNRALLVNQNGEIGAGDGATVLFDPAGNPTYVNFGCFAPVPPFLVDIQEDALSGCAGTTVQLTATAEGQQSLLWSSTTGTFSDATILTPTFTIPEDAVDTIILTLTATDACGNTTSDTIQINLTDALVPDFETSLNLCSGGSVPVLVTTSPNGISGTWNPDTIHPTLPGDYIFTPFPGQCAVPITMTIEVNPLETPIFDAVAPICSGTTLAELPTISTNGISGSWSPDLNNTETTTYTFTPVDGQCATTATLTIEITESITPVFESVEPICLGISVNPLPAISTNGISGSWSPDLNNTETTTYTFTPVDGQCAVPVTLIIEVNPLETPTFDAVAPVCSGTTLAELPTISNNGISGSWSPILDTTTTTTYTFTPSQGVCATTATLTIVITEPIIPVFDAVVPICLGTTLDPLPTVSNNGIEGSWSPALSSTATTTYFFTPTEGQCATGTELTIFVNDVPQFSITEGCDGFSYTLRAEVSSSGDNVTYAWLNASGVQIGSEDSVVASSSGIYRLVVTQNGCSDELEVFVSSTLCEIQRGISPNNDQQNDSFDLSNFKVSELQIFNRYGINVYSRANYSNEWFGQCNKGNELPDGTYFYVIHFQEDESKTGWIYINKEY